MRAPRSADGYPDAVPELEHVPDRSNPYRSSLERHRLATSLRHLLDAVVRTGADEATLAQAADTVDRLTDTLSTQTFARTTEISWDSYRAEMSLVGGVAHPAAAQLRMSHIADEAAGTVTLGPAFEGGPGLVHGGVVSLLLDHAMAFATATLGRPVVTATMTLDFRRPTPLGEPLDVRSRIERVDGRKVHVTGSISAHDETTVECTGLFIQLQPDAIDAIYSVID